MSKTPKFNVDGEVTSNVKYAGNAKQVETIMTSMKPKQNSIVINGYIVIRKSARRYEFGKWMGDFHIGSLKEVIARIS